MAAKDNIDLGGCDVYVGYDLVGATQGKCGISYSPTIKEYRAGYPSYVRGAEITAQSASVSIGILELTVSNIALSLADASVSYDQGGNATFYVGKNVQPVIIENMLFHKYNPGNGKHLTVKVWKAFVTSECAVKYEQNSEEWVLFDVDMTIVGDPGNHPNNPLFEMKLSNSFTPPAPPVSPVPANNPA